MMQSCRIARLNDSVEANELELGQKDQKGDNHFWRRLRNAIRNTDAEAVVNDNDARPSITPKGASILPRTKVAFPSEDGFL